MKAKEQLMAIANRYTPLSVKSLERAWDWAEPNQLTDPLAEAYMDACLALGSCDTESIGRKYRLKRGPYYALKDAKCFAFALRDTIGRVILEKLKREAKPAP